MSEEKILNSERTAEFWDKVKEYVDSKPDATFLIKAPIGTIVIWSGTANDIPNGWVLCDGENNTPDLRDKFVLGAGTHAVGEMGGEEEVTLTVEQMPKHNHSISARVDAEFGSGSYLSRSTGGTVSNLTTASVGSSYPHPNMPPYYALCFIMKITIDETDVPEYSAGRGVALTDTAEGKDINVELPTVTLTKAAYNALSDEEKQSETMYAVIDDTESPIYIVNAPIGAIMVWSGTEDSVPQGWSICNGENGTPDYRGRFILGASESHEVGETGGSEDVTLTVEQMPSHTHPIIHARATNIATGGNTGRDYLSSAGTNTYYTESAGNSQPHPNMPPYYTALWIQKTGVTPSDYATEERVQEIVQEALSDQPAGSNVPSGGIIIWSGASNAVPDGWALCNGQNGTPDLRGRFVLGESESHTMGSTGGAEEVTLSVAQMPQHDHLINLTSSTNLTTLTGAIPKSDTIQGSTTTGKTGSSEPHPNMPPYYTLAYIMKL